MRIKKIALSGFRNYEWETAEFNEGTNVISGENAQGKTNLLEAVYMLSCGRSFRTRFDRELIGFGYSGAEILADVVSHEARSRFAARAKDGRVDETPLGRKVISTRIYISNQKTYETNYNFPLVHIVHRNYDRTETHDVSHAAY